jgi:hypothetical protein
MKIPLPPPNVPPCVVTDCPRLVFTKGIYGSGGEGARCDAVKNLYIYLFIYLFNIGRIYLFIYVFLL